MFFKSCIVFCFCAVVTSAASAAEWPRQAVDIAISVVKKSEVDLEKCVETGGTRIAYEAKQMDLNGDGVYEVEISSSVEQYGTGATACYAAGHNVYLLIYDGKGGWNSEFGDGAGSLEYHARGPDLFPDVEITGPGFCFPIWRYFKGHYGIWKTCDDNNRLVFADTADISTTDIVPRDAGETTAVQTARHENVATYGPMHVDLRTIHAPAYEHNGSIVLLDYEHGLIVYSQPKASIAGTVHPGDVLFRGRPWDLGNQHDLISGTAYVFKKGCAPAPYRVTGTMGEVFWTATLTGAAPVRRAGSCDIQEYRATANSRLQFNTTDE